MDWLNLHSPTVLRSPEYIGEDPTNRSTWLSLATYCALQENGGIIRACAAWKDRRWQQLAAVTREETRRPSELWAWVGEDIHVVHYPAEKEAEVRRKREIAKTNGRKSGGRPCNPAKTNVGSQQKPTSVISPKTEGEGEGERKGNTPLAPHGGDEPFDIVSIVALYPRHERQAEALEIVRRHIDRGADPASIAAGTRAIAAVISRLPGGHLNKFVPSALTFFRDRRWEDDPATWLRSTTAANGAPPTKLDLGGRRPADTILIP
jgi:hypothetical protein